MKKLFFKDWYEHIKTISYDFAAFIVLLLTVVIELLITIKDLVIGVLFPIIQLFQSVFYAFKRYIKRKD